jgi:hypothetical protein
VSVEPVELLGDIEALQHQQDLLLDALLIDLGAELAQALLESLADPACASGRSGACRADHAGQRGAALADQRREPLAFAQRARASSVNVSPNSERTVCIRLRIGAVLAQDSRKAQQVDQVDLRAPGMPPQFIDPRQQAGERLLIDLQRCAAGRHRALLQRAVDLAAPQFAPQRLAQFRLQRTAAVGQAQRRIQETVIDAANFADECAKGAGELAPGKTRHACDHWKNWCIKRGEV